MPKVVGVRFKRASKIYDFDPAGLTLEVGDLVVVESEKGMALGRIAYGPKEKNEKGIVRPLKRVIRKANEADMERLEFNREREREAFRVCQEKIHKNDLQMKLVDVEYLFDSSKAVFYFTSETRVDFRDLVKGLANEFHTRIEMRQLGVRDEAKLIGGIGPCGREICCSAFLTDFGPVTVKMAKDQNLALNPAKISGICGRLMCCLSYEYERYQGRAAATDLPPDCNGCVNSESADGEVGLDVE